MESDHLPIKRSRTRSAEQSVLLDRSLVQKWSKDELHDKFLTLYNEHNQQKEKFRELEEENKRNKLAMNKAQDKLRHTLSESGAGAAELRATDQVAKLELRLVELQKENAQLLGRAALRKAGPRSQQQQQPTASRRGSYRGGGGGSSSARLARSASGDGGDGRQLLLEIESLREQLSLKDMELREAVKDVHSERDLTSLQASDSKLLSMQDGLERVRSQRQLREKAAVIEQMQIKCETLEERVRDLQAANAALVQSSEQARLSARLHESSSVGGTAADQVVQKRAMQLEHALLEDARAEAQVLRESNEQLIGSAFDTQKERQWRIREMALLAQIRQLESRNGAASASVGVAGSQPLGADAQDSELERELSAQRIRYYELQLKHETLQERLRIVDYKKQGIQDEEFLAALALVRRQRETAAELQATTPDLSFLKSTGAVGGGGGQKRLLELEATQADTLLELEKARQLLKAQQLLTNDTKAGHGLTEFRLEELRTEYEARIAELNRLLEIRTARIRQLEEQLAKVGYGGQAAAPRQLPVQAPPLPSKTSRSGSVVEESCVEKIQGVAESTYRMEHSRARPKSGQVVGSMSGRIQAPLDLQLSDGGGSESDAESVHSVVAAPVNVKPGETARSLFTKESIKLVIDAKIRELTGAEAGSGYGHSIPPPPPYEEAKQSHPEPLPRKQREPESDEEKEEADEADEAAVEDSDSGVVVLDDPPATAASATSSPDIVSTCYVQVFEIHLNEASQALENPDLDDTGCYVTFNLPGYSGEEVETPLSIRTPRPGVSKETDFTLRYNFKRIYDFNFDRNYAKRRSLAAALLLRDQPTLTFTVVCEALDGTDFYVDLARAELPLTSLIDGQERATEKILPLTSSADGQPVGTIKVGQDLPRLLRALRRELPADKRQK